MTWFELLVDFELTAGVKCQSLELEEQLPWGDRARVLMRVIKALLTCRGGGPGALKKNFGYGKRTASLAPFGLRHLPGLQRRPVFAAGLATSRVVGASACTWALAGGKGPLAKFQTDYKGFQLGRAKNEELQARYKVLVEEAAEEEKKVLRRCRQKTLRRSGHALQ